MRLGQGLTRSRAGLLLLAWIVTGFGSPLGGQAGAEEPVSAIPDEALGVPFAPILLLTRSDVRSDLRMTDEQTSRALETVRILRLQAASLRGRTKADVVAGLKGLDASERRWLKENLTPEQQVRLSQLDLQWEGAGALVRRPIVADSIGLDATQRQALQTAVAVRDASRRQSPDAAETPQAQAAKILAAEKVLGKTTLGLLTDAQKQRYHAMLGRPCEFKTSTAAAAAPAVNHPALRGN